MEERKLDSGHYDTGSSGNQRSKGNKDDIPSSVVVKKEVRAASSNG